MSKQALCNGCPAIVGCDIRTYVSPKDIHCAPCGALIGRSGTPNTFWVVQESECKEAEDGLYTDTITFCKRKMGIGSSDFEIATYEYKKPQFVAGRITDEEQDDE